MIVDAGCAHFFEQYPLLPNREHILLKRADLRNAESINDQLYQLVKALSPEICRKMIHQDYADLIELPSYSWQNLRDELNDCVKEVENSHWKRSNHPGPYSGDFEYNLIKFCSRSISCANFVNCTPFIIFSFSVFKIIFIITHYSP